MLNKESFTEFWEFIFRSCWQKCPTDAEQEKQINDMWKHIEKSQHEITLPNPEKPEYPIRTKEYRTTFKAIWAMVLPAAKTDGCIFIPYEETTDEKRKQKQTEELLGNLAADHDPMGKAAASSEATKKD